MSRYVEFSCFTTYDDAYNLIQFLTIKIGVMDLTFRIKDDVRLKILEFFAAPSKHDKLSLELDGLFCPTIRVNNKYIHLPTEVDEAMDTFGVKKGGATR